MFPLYSSLLHISRRVYSGPQLFWLTLNSGFGSAQSPKAKPVGQAESPTGGSSSIVVVMVAVVSSIASSWKIKKLTKNEFQTEKFTLLIHNWSQITIHIKDDQKTSNWCQTRLDRSCKTWIVGQIDYCIISWLPAAKLQSGSWSWLFPWLWSWMWSCCPSWLWTLSCCPWQCWIQRAFLGSNVFQYWQTRSETNTWSTRVNRINLLKSQNWLLPRIGRHHGASCRGCWYRPTTLPVNCRRSKSCIMGAGNSFSNTKTSSNSNTTTGSFRNMKTKSNSNTPTHPRASSLTRPVQCTHVFSLSAFGRKSNTNLMSWGPAANNARRWSRMRSGSEK